MGCRSSWCTSIPIQIFGVCPIRDGQMVPRRRRAGKLFGKIGLGSVRSSQYDRWSQFITVGCSFAGNWPGKQRIWGVDGCLSTSDAGSEPSIMHADFIFRRGKWNGAPIFQVTFPKLPPQLMIDQMDLAYLQGTEVHKYATETTVLTGKKILWDAIVRPNGILWSWVDWRKFIVCHLKRCAKDQRLIWCRYGTSKIVQNSSIFR